MATELADVVDYGHMLKDRLLTLLRVLCNSTNDTFCVYYKGRQWSLYTVTSTSQKTSVTF